MASVTRPSRAAVALLVTAVVAVLAAVAAGALRPWAAPVAEVQQASAEQSVITPATIRLPEQPRVLVFGDSWTYGSAATPIHRGYAYVLAELLGGTTVVDGGRGSGYLRPGIDRPDFATRIAALDPSAAYDLIVIQGSINDRHSPAQGYGAAVNAAWDELVRIYPDTPVVVLGPAPQVLPVEPATARIDRDLASLAADRQWWYISPIRDQWITPENYATVIDTSELGRDHPSVAGHAYLAQRLAEALHEITDPVTSVEASDGEAAEPVAPALP
ncbi:SGNH/GDSL hydrolase family protein [Microbacterium paludicola]|uniref:SGNH/GDSL hydrolase family protein n=1 Tax=Microbacterium paludicola TaxID=300019 RepID=A0A4Y9FV94_9MICO|nr:SGNH/GDSL hydrolase family protein [Microbacterium paludicola]TFU32460.1 SGNH/GDSL hydrolase family protein [Microbacterium paludicola]